MTDTVAQAADAVKSDVNAAIAADATGGTVAAAESIAGSAAHIAGQAIIAGADAAQDLSADAEQAVPAAKSLYSKIEAELAGSVSWLEHEWAALEAAIAKHL
ncbi:MAG TPA: hypothetical protein VF534_01180 [Paraburkholderia sp.]